MTFFIIGQKSVAIIYDFQVSKHSVGLFEGLINAFEYLNPRPWLSSEKKIKRVTPKLKPGAVRNCSILSLIVLLFCPFC